MKTLRTLVACGLVAACAFAATVPAQAQPYGSVYYRGHGHGGHGHYGFSVGVPLGGYYGPGPWPYYPRYYYPYPPAVVAVPVQPPVYIEQPQMQAAPMPAPAPQVQGSNYWYYCVDSKTYYPYVEQCPSPWQRVIPQPAPGAPPS